MPNHETTRPRQYSPHDYTAVELVTNTLQHPRQRFGHLSDHGFSKKKTLVAKIHSSRNCASQVTRLLSWPSHTPCSHHTPQVVTTSPMWSPQSPRCFRRPEKWDHKFTPKLGLFHVYMQPRQQQVQRGECLGHRMYQWLLEDKMSHAGLHESRNCSVIAQSPWR